MPALVRIHSNPARRDPTSILDGLVVELISSLSDVTIADQFLFLFSRVRIYTNPKMSVKNSIRIPPDRQISLSNSYSPRFLSMRQNPMLI
jgi:hypothetical protein